VRSSSTNCRSTSKVWMSSWGEGFPAFDASKDANRFDSVRAGEAALRVHLWEPLEPGSTTFTHSDVWFSSSRGVYW
jgi:hypothetical protein